MKDYEKDIILFVYKFKIVLSTNIKYLLGTSYIASIFIGNNIEFVPSFELKDNSNFRTQSRPFIGSIKFNGNDFLIYYISKKSRKHFCNSIIYDFQKEHKYKQAVLLIEDIELIKLDDFVLGSDQFLVIPLPYEKLIYLFNKQFKIDYRAILIEFKYDDYFLSNLYFCDYETKSKKFVTFLPFIDSEKIYKLIILDKENKKYIDNLLVFCSEDVYIILKIILPFLNIVVVDFKQYVNDFRIYSIEDNKY